MINYLHSGDTLPLIAPYAAPSGGGIKVGAIFGVACGSAQAGVLVEVKRTGAFLMPSVAADTFAQGAKVYWDDTAKTCTSTAGTNMLIGAAIDGKSSGIASVRVVLDGIAR